MWKPLLNNFIHENKWTRMLRLQTNQNMPNTPVLEYHIKNITASSTTVTAWSWKCPCCWNPRWTPHLHQYILVCSQCPAVRLGGWYIAQATPCLPSLLCYVGLVEGGAACIQYILHMVNHTLVAKLQKRDCARCQACQLHQRVTPTNTNTQKRREIKLWTSLHWVATVDTWNYLLLRWKGCPDVLILSYKAAKSWTTPSQFEERGMPQQR